MNKSFFIGVALIGSMMAHLVGVAHAGDLYTECLDNAKFGYDSQIQHPAPTNADQIIIDAQKMYRADVQNCYDTFMKPNMPSPEVQADRMKAAAQAMTQDQANWDAYVKRQSHDFLKSLPNAQDIKTFSDRVKAAGGK
jgi:hypothetical protein